MNFWNSFAKHCQMNFASCCLEAFSFRRFVFKKKNQENKQLSSFSTYVQPFISVDFLTEHPVDWYFIIHDLAVTKYYILNWFPLCLQSQCLSIIPYSAAWYSKYKGHKMPVFSHNTSFSCCVCKSEVKCWHKHCEVVTSITKGKLY